MGIHIKRWLRRYLFAQQVVERLAFLEGEVAQLVRVIVMMERKMSAELDRLTASVERNRQVGQSVMTLVEGLAQQIRDIGDIGDVSAMKAKMTELADSLDAETQTFASAVEANTPSSGGGGTDTVSGGEDTTGGASV